jgi:hypothetical protein
MEQLGKRRGMRRSEDQETRTRFGKRGGADGALSRDASDFEEYWKRNGTADELIG